MTKNRREKRKEQRRHLQLARVSTQPPDIAISGIDVKLVKNPARLVEGLQAHLHGDYTTAAQIYYELDSGSEGPHYEARFLAAILCREALEPHRGIALLREVIAARPQWPDPVYNLGVFLDEVGDYHEAARAYRQALALNPNFASAHINYGNYCLGYGRPDEAMDHYRRAMEIAPDQAEARVNAAHALLLTGDYEQGWAYYEHRWITPAFKARNGLNATGSAMWDGETAPGKRILVFHEQGFGDTLMCLRYLRVLKEAGMYVIARVPQRMVTLVTEAALGDEVISETDELPPHDCIVPFMSLPYHCKTRFDSIPLAGGYLLDYTPPSTMGRLSFGVVWAGSPIHKNDRNRSITPALIKPIIDRTPHIEWHSLQVGPRASEAYELGLEPCPEGTFLETARIIAGLHGVLAVDTATAHLAGAMGVPTILLLPSVPDMRWGMQGDSTPWYDSMTILRQPRRGDWYSVMNALLPRLQWVAVTAEAAVA